MKENLIKILSPALYKLKIFKAKNRSEKLISFYFRDNSSPKLQIGCGLNLKKGWLNTDINPSTKEVVYLDATKKFPFEDNTFEFIFSEHVFEHLYFKDSCNMISECYRVLKPNGVLRIAVPKIDFLFEILSNPELPLHKEYTKWHCDKYYTDVAEFFKNEKNANLEVYVINNFFKDWGHQVLHNFESIKKLLTMLKFTDVKNMTVGISEYKELSNIEQHHHIIPEKFNKLETLVIEAKKVV